MSGAGSHRTSEGRTFEGTERFEIQSRLGAGGMGVVYECLDKKSGRRLALKTLERSDADSLYRFKQEFRGLADISHPNLVTLHELVSTEEQWFFTMELIRGKSLYAYVRGLSSAEAADPLAHTALQSDESLDEELAHEATMPTGGSFGPTMPPDMERLRAAMSQLAQGVHALHCAGKLHRDIKPPNVLVDESGRVVVVDFGLSTDYMRPDEVGTQALAGTVAYMSPEQASGMPLGPASDWYSVGVVLYELLTGCLPFTGNPTAVLMIKQVEDPKSPQELLPGLPDDLCDLCTALLQREPAKRPSGNEVLERLGVARPDLKKAYRAGPSTKGRTFVGRESSLEELESAFRPIVEGKGPRAVVLEGSPGIGKTALLEEFCSRMMHRHQALVLSGRCYEREQVPFKAVDTIVDALSKRLGRMGRDELGALLPKRVRAMARLFPVFNTVHAIAQVPRLPLPPDVHEARRQGLDALRELLVKLSESVPLILRIDDFQWGDRDSVTLLGSLLDPPSPPNLLLIVSFRKGEDEGANDNTQANISAAVQAWRLLLKDLLARGQATHIELGPMSADETQLLAQHRLKSILANHDETSERFESEAMSVARESGGSPFFVEEFMRYLHDSTAEHDEAPKLGELSLEQVMNARFEHLTPDQRKLLELIASAGMPVSERVALRAAGLDEHDGVSVAVLRAGQLIRGQQGTNSDLLESFHDRIRETLVAQLSEEERKENNLQLATALASVAPDDSDALALYFSRAGRPVEAALHARKAAKRAQETLAFERAVLFLRMALEAAPEDRELRTQLADALSYTGRGADAAEQYLRAARDADSATQLELSRLAAEQYLRSGHVEEGVEILRRVLASVGMKLASSSQTAFASLLKGRLQLRLRGLSFKERDSSQLSAEYLRKVDTCWSCAIGLGLTDPIRGSDFQTRHLLLALKGGEPYRLARAMGLEGAYRAIDGASGFDKAMELIETATELAERSGNPHAAGLARFSRGLAHYQIGKWQAAFDEFEASSRVLRQECKGVAFEVSQSLRFGVDALFNLGDLDEMARRVPDYLRAAERRGDLYGATDMRTGLPNAVWLVADQPERARSECELGADRWSNLRFYLQHYYAALAHAQIDLYQGEGWGAHERVREMWPSLRRSLLLRVQAVRSEALFLKARALLAAARERAGTRQRCLGEAGHTAKLLARQEMPGAPHLANMIRAQALMLEGQDDAARPFLESAIQGFEDADMALCEHASLMLLHQSQGQSEAGKRAQAWFETQGAAAPNKLARMIAPMIEA